MNCDYCSACGGKVEYLLNKPNFCPNCGAPIGGASVKSPLPVAKRNISSIQKPEEDPEGTDVSSVPSVQGLQYEIEGNWNSIGRNHGTIGQLFNSTDTTSPPQNNAPAKSQPKAKASKKRATSEKKPSLMPEAVKQSMKDCQSSADNPADVE
mgnify:FL=1